MKRILKTFRKLSAIFTVGAFLCSCTSKSSEPEKDEQTKHKEHEEHEEYELAPKMANFQRFFEKLYFSGQAQNWELAAFYVEELEEGAEEIIKKKVFEDGVNVSEFMKVMFLPSIEKVEQSIKQKDEKNFSEQMISLSNSCNACHTTTKHEFVKIQIPKQNNYPSQVFSK